MAAVSCPCNLPSLPLRCNKTATKTGRTASFSVTAISKSSATVSCVVAPLQILPQFSSGSLQYEQGKVGAVPDGRVSKSSVGAMEYLTRILTSKVYDVAVESSKSSVGAMEYLTIILTSKVYDVAVESPLQHATKMSERLGVDIWLKREDARPVFSFKLRGAYNMMAKLPKEQLAKGVVCSSAGNHAQGVALAAKTLGCDAVIIMPVTAPQIKIESLKRLSHCARVLENRTFIPPFDHPDVITGQGTIGMEILHQLRDPIHAIFVPVGGGGLIAGIAAYVKRVSPKVRVIGVEPTDANDMALSLHHGQRVMLDQVGGFADGVAVKEVGVEPFRICKELIDGVVLVNHDAICTSIKDMFEEKRSILEPAGALALAGAEAYCRYYDLKDKNIVAITSGANINFDRLSLISELANVGRQQEAMLNTHIPNELKSIEQFSKLLSTSPLKHHSNLVPKA